MVIYTTGNHVNRARPSKDLLRLNFCFPDVECFVVGISPVIGMVLAGEFASFSSFSSTSRTSCDANNKELATSPSFGSRKRDLCKQHRNLISLNVVSYFTSSSSLLLLFTTMFLRCSLKKVCVT